MDAVVGLNGGDTQQIFIGRGKKIVQTRITSIAAYSVRFTKE